MSSGLTAVAIKDVLQFVRSCPVIFWGIFGLFPKQLFYIHYVKAEIGVEAKLYYTEREMFGFVTVYREVM